jgi:hypothetical protein
VNARRQRIGLQTSLSVQRNNRAIGQRAVLPEKDPFLVGDSYLVLRDNDGSKELTQDCLVQHHNEEEQDYPSPIAQDSQKSPRSFLSTTLRERTSIHPGD